MFFQSAAFHSSTLPLPRTYIVSKSRTAFMTSLKYDKKPGLMTMNDCYATCVLVLKYHVVINHHRHGLFSFSLPQFTFFFLQVVKILSFRSCGGTTNKVTKTASCSMCIIILLGLDYLVFETSISLSYNVKSSAGFVTSIA